MVGYKHLLLLAGQGNYPEAFKEAEGIFITLLHNLRDRLRTVPTNELASMLDVLPAPQLASVLAILLADQSGVSDPSGERLQIVSSFTSRLVSLLFDADLPPEIFERAKQLAYRPGTDEVSLVAKANMSLGIASPLCYGSIYLPVIQATTQSRTSSPTLDLPFIESPTPSPTPEFLFIESRTPSPTPQAAPH
jgi:hypothetical protein